MTDQPADETTKPARKPRTRKPRAKAAPAAAPADAPEPTAEADADQQNDPAAVEPAAPDDSVPAPDDHAEAMEASTAEAPDDEPSMAPSPEPEPEPEPELVADAPIEPSTLPSNSDNADPATPSKDAWLTDTASRAWPGLTETANTPEPRAVAHPATDAWTAPADEAWPEPTLPGERAWSRPRRELGRREAGLALGFLALGVISGTVIGANITVPLAPPTAITQQQDTTLGQAIRTAQTRTVTITVDSPSGPTGRGAGTIIGNDGTVITTNAVVASSGDTVRVTTAEGRVLNATFVGTDQTTGLTVLNVRGLRINGFTVTASDGEDGSPVAVIGQNNNATATSITSPRQSVNSVTGNAGVGTWTSAVRLATADDHTATGGPVVNRNGALIGIAVSGVTTTRDSDPEGRQYALDADVATAVARSIASTGVALHGRIGAEVADTVTGIVGARITDIADDSASDTAGLRTDDVIIGFNGDRIGNAAQLVATVRGTEPGTTAKVTYLRNGKERTTTVKVTATQ